MDVVAHTLWTNAVFYSKYARQRKERYWAAFFGVLPDLIAFVPVQVYIIVQGLLRNLTVGNYQEAFKNPVGIYDFTVQAYNYSHSFVVFAVVFIVIWLARRGKPYWPLLGWGLHIFIDIFTHTLDFFPTPFLYPLSNYHNPHGITWANPIFMAVNYSVLIVVYIIIWRYQKRYKLAHEQK